MLELKQSYKNRTEAFRKLISPLGYPVGQAQFYRDFSEGFDGRDGQRYSIALQADKSVQLCDLIDYAVRKFTNGPAMMVESRDQELEKRLAELNLRKQEAETKTAENKAKKEDDKYMEVVEHDQQLAAFAGLLDEGLSQLANLKLAELIYRCGGDSTKAADFAQALSDLHTEALTEAVRDSVRVVEFDGDDEEDETES
jgi:hypothetical protein